MESSPSLSQKEKNIKAEKNKKAKISVYDNVERESEESEAPSCELCCPGKQRTGAYTHGHCRLRYGEAASRKGVVGCDEID